MGTFDSILITLNAFLWQDTVLFLLLGTGILFTVWSGVAQYRSVGDRHGSLKRKRSSGLRIPSLALEASRS